MFSLLSNVLAVDCTGIDDHAALVAIYNAYNGPAWIGATNWNTAANVCTWAGVLCNGGGLVIELNVTGFGLTPVTATSSLDKLGCLVFLKSLTLNNNLINGPFAAGICQLTNLQYFNAIKTGFNGALPVCICGMTNLMYLYLNNNLFSGPIPSCLGQMTFLHSMYLTCNNLDDPTTPINFAGAVYLTEFAVNCQINIAF